MDNIMQRTLLRCSADYVILVPRNTPSEYKLLRQRFSTSGIATLKVWHNFKLGSLNSAKNEKNMFYNMIKNFKMMLWVIFLLNPCTTIEPQYFNKLFWLNPELRKSEIFTS